MNYRISIANRQKVLRIDRRAMTSLARLTLKIEQVAAAEISVAFVGDVEIHEINRTFLNHDFPTDVISFLLDGSPESVRVNEPGTIRRGAGRTIDGEIIISTDTAARNASKMGTTAEYEMNLYLVHGLLHLCGYDDKTDANAARKNLWEFRWEHAQARIAARRGDPAEAQRHVAAAKAGPAVGSRQWHGREPGAVPAISDWLRSLI